VVDASPGTKVPRGPPRDPYAEPVDAWDVSLAIAFVPALSLARQQQAIEALEALAPAELELTEVGCRVRLVVQAADSESARNDGEFTLARALSSVGHTMHTAPISTASVRAAGQV